MKEKKTKLYITGDMGGRIAFFDQPCISNQLSQEDYLFIMGDFSVIFAEKEILWERIKLDRIADKEFVTCFIDGNHENHMRLQSDEFPIEKWNGGRARIIRRDKEGLPKIVYLMRGEIYEIAGKRIFCMGGAHSQDAFLRQENHDWWPNELPSKCEIENGFNNLDRVKWKVDYVFTHTLPAGIYQNEYRHFDDREESEFRQTLERIRRKLMYEHWYAGHIHQDVISEKEKFTCLFNLIRDIETGEIVGNKQE